ncbi:MAG: response regulator [Myxococcota bacterium]
MAAAPDPSSRPLTLEISGLERQALGEIKTWVQEANGPVVVASLRGLLRFDGHDVETLRSEPVRDLLPLGGRIVVLFRNHAAVWWPSRHALVPLPLTHLGPPYERLWPHDQGLLVQGAHGLEAVNLDSGENLYRLSVAMGQPIRGDRSLPLFQTATGELLALNPDGGHRRVASKPQPVRWMLAAGSNAHLAADVWYRWSGGNLERDDVLEARFPAADVSTVRQLASGEWLIGDRDGTLWKLEARGDDWHRRALIHLEGTLTALLPDLEGGVWIQSGDRIVRLHMESPVRSWPLRERVEGQPRRFRDAASGWTLITHRTRFDLAGDQPAAMTPFGLQDVFDVLPQESFHWVAASDGLWRVLSDSSEHRVLGQPCHRLLPVGPDVVMALCDGGLVEFQRRRRVWIRTDLVPEVGLSEPTDGVALDENRLLVRDQRAGLVVVHRGHDHLRPAGADLASATIATHGSPLLLASSKGIFQWEGDQAVQVWSGDAHGMRLAVRGETVFSCGPRGPGPTFRRTAEGLEPMESDPWLDLPRIPCVDLLADETGAWLATKRRLLLVPYELRGLPDPQARLTVHPLPHDGASLDPPHAGGSVMVQTAMLAPAFPQPLQFRLRIAGRRGDWTPWSAKRTVLLEDLPSGALTVLAEARDASGRRLGLGRASLFVAPPWYAQPSRVGPGAVLLLSAFLSVVYIRNRRLTRQLERRVAERTKELEATVARLQDQKLRADEATTAKSDFLAAMSHEIRTPMNGVLGMTTLLRESELNREQRELVEVAHTSASSLLRVIDDILDFSKLEAGRLDIEHLPFDPEQLVDQCMELVAGRAAERGLELAAVVGNEVPKRLKTDPTRLRQILVNLLGNAVKFTESGEVVLRVSSQALESDRHELTVLVTDTGIGIRPERLENLFRPYTQADVSTFRRFGGTGLGLAISKALTEKLGGSIGAESTLGLGSTFWVRVPVTEVSPTSGIDPLGDGRAWVLEPHEASAEALCCTLEEWGFECRMACRLEDAARLMPEGIAALSFIHLPWVATLTTEMGRQTFGRMFAISPFQETPSDQLLQELGCVGALNKPIRRRQLRAELVRTPDSMPTEDLDLEVLDPAQRDVLVVDDNAINRKVAERMLERLGYDAATAENGAVAVEMASTGRYGAILMDCHMPVMDGLEATRRLRALPWKPGRAPRIIALTASAMEQDRAACLAAGMDDFLEKPLNIERLRTALNEAEPSAECTALPDLPASASD